MAATKARHRGVRTAMAAAGRAKEIDVGAETPSVPPRPAALDEQYAELAELAGGFIHEIKNRLSTLGLNLQLLAEDFQDVQSSRERRALERVQRLQHECERLVA